MKVHFTIARFTGRSFVAQDYREPHLNEWLFVHHGPSAYGRSIRVKSGLGRGLVMVANAARWSSLLQVTTNKSRNSV